MLYYVFNPYIYYTFAPYTGMNYIRVDGTKTMSVKVDGDYWRHECNRCDKIWYSTKESPKNCAEVKCKSPYWNKARVR